jgi:hypothetical protein
MPTEVSVPPKGESVLVYEDPVSRAMCACVCVHVCICVCVCAHVRACMHVFKFDTECIIKISIVMFLFLKKMLYLNEKHSQKPVLCAYYATVAFLSRQIDLNFLNLRLYVMLLKRNVS